MKTRAIKACTRRCSLGRPLHALCTRTVRTLIDPTRFANPGCSRRPDRNNYHSGRWSFSPIFLDSTKQWNKAISHERTMEAGYHGRGGSLRSFSLSLVSRFCVIAERNDPLNCGSRTLARGKFFFFFFFFIFKRIKFHLSKKREREREIG